MPKRKGAEKPKQPAELVCATPHDPAPSEPCGSYWYDRASSGLCAFGMRRKPAAKCWRRPKPPRITARGRREKGATFEREVAELHRPHFPEACRGIGQARSSFEVADVDRVPWWMEAKSWKRPNIIAAFRQAIAAALKNGKGLRPVVVTRMTGVRPDLVTITLEHWLELVGEGERLRKEIAQRDGFA